MVLKKLSPDYFTERTKTIPIGRWGTPEDIAYAIGSDIWRRRNPISSPGNASAQTAAAPSGRTLRTSRHKSESA
jgi:hypothetical protein